MKFKNRFLDTLAGSHDKIVVFDCEFWHVYGSEGYIPIQKLSNEFFMPREVGGFVITRSADGQWIYKKEFFVTLYPPKGKDVSYVSSAFAYVSKKTAEKMDMYQAILSVPWSDAYLQKVPEDRRQAYKEGIQTYLEDSNIQKAHKPPSWIKTFLQDYSDALVIVKGSKDIEAIKNACKFHGFEYKSPKKVYDIVDWNPESHKKCGTARLEKTYECIVDELDRETAQLKKILPLGEAHDPSSDAAMTFIVALYIIQASTQ